MATLYEKLGGASKIDAVIDKFYDYVLEDEKVNHFFKNANMAKLRSRQKQFISMVTGGPHNYEGKDMKAAHQKIKIGKVDFDGTWMHLEKSLKFYQVGEPQINQLKKIFYSREKDIEKQQIQKEKTLFQRLGGEAAINAVVDKFYEYMLSDPVTAPFFANTDMKKQASRQKQFIMMATGGPNKYEGADMKKAHQKFKIGKKEFDETWHNLQKALAFFKVPEREVTDLKAVFYSVQADVQTVKEQKKSLYQRLGGEAAINAVVDKFYEYMLSDPVTAPFFANTDMKKQASRQKQFIMMATGGPNKYEGADMKKAHQKFKIGKKEFDETWHNLQKALAFFKVPEREVTDLKAVFYSVQADVQTVKEQKKSLYQRLGGEAAINAVVDKFYEYMLSDPVTAPFFANTDMKKQASRQKQFIMMATGGPNKYEGADMKKAHQKFKIGKKEFDETWHNLQKALAFFKVPEREVTDLKAVFYSVQADVQTVKEQKKSLYQRLGGEAAINAVVDKFYEYMLSDPVTAPFFANTDMKKQASRQKQFIMMATGGPNKYEGADMKKAHQKFKIGKKEFDETWHNLQKALAFFKVPEREVTDLKAVFYSVQADVQTVKQSNKLSNQKFLQFSKAALINPHVKVFKQIIGGLSSHINPPKKSLYQRLGGQQAISAVVDKFYQYMLSDSITSPFFANTDMKKQASRQKQFIMMATGGPNKYEGADMKKAHQKFKIGKKEFDETWHNLQKALAFFKVPEREVTDLKAVFYSVQADVQTVKEQKKSLYQRLGGEAAINAVVDKFYEYMLSDPVTAPFFANTDMKKQASRQKQFIMMATGGPNKYEGADMKKAHQKFKIGKKEFDETWHNLQKALAFFKVPEREVTDLKAVFYSVQADVQTVKEQKKSLYQRLGGEAAINAVVDKFYEYMLSDPVTAPFFANTDMKKQASRQKQFIMMATGGPNKYEGADMKKAHQKFKIGKKEFDETWHNLQKALAFFKVPEREVTDLKAVFYSVQADVQTVKEQKKSLYQRLGGEAAINAVVDKFYEYMLSDPVTAPFFANTDMKKQASRQKQFIMMATGGPNKYEGADMKKAHQKFKIGKKEFDETWHNLQKALAFFKVPEREVTDLKAVFYSVQADVSHS